MRYRFTAGFFVAAAYSLLSVLTHAASVPDDPEGKAMIEKAQQNIAAFHAGAPAANAKLRVVYFHPSDRDPLPNYEERLDRVLNDVSEFYRDGLRRFGIASEGLPLEKKDGRLVLHMVKGKLPASGYRHESGNATAAEIREALRGTVDLDREHVLVLYGLCRKEPDGRYVFDAPYYGGGSQRAGLCHAADCELLDPSLLTDTAGKIVYTEHYYPRLEQTIAKFNSMYLGGIAHELGHGLGLPHDSGSVAEKTFGISIMGSGNLTYRQERWGGGPPVFMTRASALQYVSHPFVTGTDQGRWDSPRGKFESLSFSAEGTTLKVHGTATGKIPVYGVIGYVLPTTEKTDHRSRTYPALARDGTFELALNELRPGEYLLSLAALHVNGATSARGLKFTIKPDSVPDVNQLNDFWITQKAERAVMRREPNAGAFLTDEAIAAAPTPDVQRKLKALRAVLNPPAQVDLRSVEANETFLSDVTWLSAKVGWGEVARNHFWFDEKIQNGVFLTLAGEFHEKGLYAHSPSQYLYELNQQWKTFSASVGLRDGAQQQGSAVFIVRGDGKELYRSSVLRVGAREKVSVDTTGVKTLELLTEGGEGHAHNSWAIWVDPKVTR